MADEIIIETSTPEIIEVGLVGPQGPKGDKGDAGDVAGSIAWDSVTDKPASFTPSAHASSHYTGGTDALAPSDIGAAWAVVEEALGSISGTVQLSAARAKRYSAVNISGSIANISLPQSGHQSGDIVQIVNSSAAFPIRILRNTIQIGSLLQGTGDSITFVATGSGSSNWSIIAVDTHTHAASDITSGTLTHERGGLEADVSAYDGLVKISGGSTSAVTVTTAGEALLDDADAAAQRTTLGLGNSATLDTGTTAGTVAAGDHTHELTALDATGATNGHVLTAQGDGTAAFAAASGGVTGAAASASDVLGVSGSDITGVDAGSDKIVFWDDSASKLAHLATVGPTFDGTNLRWPVELIIACSDETTNLTTGTAKVTFRAPHAFTLTAVRASVNTAPTGSTLIVDINNGANSALSTKLSIDASEKTSTTAASAAVIDTSYDDISDDAEITIDIDQIGSTIAGKGLKVTLIGTRA